MTVIEYVKEKQPSKVWLCPDTVYHPKFNPNPLLQGYECTKSTVPEKLRNKEMVKHFLENGFTCIIWKNDNEEEF